MTGLHFQDHQMSEWGTVHVTEDTACAKTWERRCGLGAAGVQAMKLHRSPAGGGTPKETGSMESLVGARGRGRLLPVQQAKGPLPTLQLHCVHAVSRTRFWLSGPLAGHQSALEGRLFF